MAVSRNTTVADIKPLEGAIIRRYIPGATITAGECVSMSSDGYIDPADASTWVRVIGVALQSATGAGVPGLIDVVVFGPVECISGATIGANIYVSDTAGEYSETVGTKDLVVGWAEAADVLFVQCGFIDWS